MYLFLTYATDPSSSSTQNDSEEPPPKRQKLFGNYTHTREHHSDTATDVSVAELLARYLRDLDGDCDSEPVDFWIRNKATYDKLIPAVQRTFAIPASSAPVKRVFSHSALCYGHTEHACLTNFCLNSFF